MKEKNIAEEKKRLLNTKRYDLEDAISVIQILRGEGGCPWDAEQTHESIRDNLVEEAYEVLYAIETNDIPSLYDELGDVLMQVIFHAEIGEQEKEFDMNDICTAMCEKMIRRHPHVFGDVVAETSDKVLENWEEIKKVEKGLDSNAKTLLDVPETLPALTRAYKVQKKAAKVGFDWDNPADVFDKVQEELNEVREAYEAVDVDGGMKKQAVAHLHEEIGDLLFASVNLSRSLGVYPEEGLRAANSKFITRFVEMEKLALAEGKNLDDMSLTEMDFYWEKAKKLLAEG